MPRRIIIHAGFHKTGTSAIQATLRENRVAMKKHTALRLRWHLKDVLSASRGYSTDLDPLTMVKVQSRFGTMMNELPGMPKRTLIVSAEELGGHLPGRGRLSDYGAMPVLLYAYWEIAKARYPAADVLFYLSTRAPDAWLASAYWEHVKSSNMTLDFDAFCETYRLAADLDAMVAEVATRVPARVHSCALEACQDLPLGPTDPLLDLCDIPLSLRTELTPAGVINDRLGDDVLAELLAVNRAEPDGTVRKAAKDAILARARTG